MELSSTKKCPACKKEFTVLWPSIWAYKTGQRNTKYYCSWRCLRTLDKRKECKKKVGVNLSEVNRKAVNLALDGKDPLPWIAENGSKKPAAIWYQIKRTLKDGEPETYARLPDLRKLRKKAPVETPEGEFTLGDAMQGMQAAADEFFQACGLPAEEPEKERPRTVAGFPVSGVIGYFGEWHYDQKHGYIDFNGNDGEEISMPAESWEKFWEEFRTIRDELGVKP